ncbi:MAG TPA: group II intron reverse transcriptase/maturase [Verrucomicrobiae bacterium]|nr:group II intron reverse transcriptase/maturase [Verrucomicrobiae bacterium]
MGEAAPEKTIETSEVDLRGGSRKLRPAQASGANSPGAEEQTEPRKPDLIETMLERGNLIRALQGVERNAGAAGSDGMETSQLRRYLLEHWDRIKEQILNGSYEPRPVRRVDIPKAGGGTRRLGIPTVLDRFLQQAIQQTLSPIWESVFSAHSYGFRPGRSAQQAIKAAQSQVRSGRRWVVDLDLEKFFDRVNHDALMARIARRVKDERMLRLIRRYLESGIMLGGVVEQRVEGTPQGGPLSPLLSNILLDDLDQELEKRGHRFCRYADDCNIYVGSRRAGERVMQSLIRYLWEKLKLTVNRIKSAVERPWKRKFLGFSLTAEKESRVRVAPQSVERFRDKLREKFREGRGRNLRTFLEGLKPLLRGWAGYFSVAQTRGVFEELDQWIRRKLRCMEWRKWKRGRTRCKRLTTLGLDGKVARASAFNGHGPWWNSDASHLNAALPTAYFRRMGLLLLIEEVDWQTALKAARS